MKRQKQFAQVLVTFLCAFLAFFMTAEVAHSHPAGDPDSSAIHCQFCATAHVAVASQPAWLTGFVLNLIGDVSIGEPTRGSRIVIPTAFIRPPPAVVSSLS